MSKDCFFVTNHQLQLWALLAYLGSGKFRLEIWVFMIRRKYTIEVSSKFICEMSLSTSDFISLRSSSIFIGNQNPHSVCFCFNRLKNTNFLVFSAWLYQCWRQIPFLRQYWTTLTNSNIGNSDIQSRTQRFFFVSSLNPDSFITAWSQQAWQEFFCIGVLSSIALV